MSKASQALVEANRRICQNQRRKALERYYEDPKRCKHCGTIIIVGANQRVSNAKRATFCTKSCAAQYNNEKFPKRKPKKDGVCESCGSKIEYLPRLVVDGKRQGYRKRKFCDSCGPKIKSENLRKRQQSIGNGLPKPISEMTKKDLRDHYKWHLTYKTQIGRNAKKVFASTGRIKECQHCGFVHGVQVCHVRDIKDFPDDALISEINAPDNLVALCPNCHWMFDHNLLQLTGKKTKRNKTKVLEATCLVKDGKSSDMLENPIREDPWKDLMREVVYELKVISKELAF